LSGKREGENIERITRRLAGERLRRDGIIPLLIERIKAVLEDAAVEQAGDALPPGPKSAAAIKSQITRGTAAGLPEAGTSADPDDEKPPDQEPRCP
jgi:hypothetical protein